MQAAHCSSLVALKASAPDLVHKSDVGGVALDLADEESVERAYRDVAAAVGDTKPK